MRLQQLVRGAVAGDEEALDIFNIGNKEIFDFCADFRQGSLANLAPRRHWTLEQISCKLMKKIYSDDETTTRVPRVSV